MKGTKLTEKHTVLIRDESLYDAELSLSVANLNAVKNSSFPKFAYVGIAWAGNAQTKDQIVANVEEVFTEYVKAAIARNEYHPVTPPPSLLSRPVLQSSSPPVLKLDVFEMTQPTSNNELHWLRETVTKAKACGDVLLPDSEVWKGLGWAQLFEKHNQEFNPQEVIRAKRGPETDVAVLLVGNDLVIQKHT